MRLLLLLEYNGKVAEVIGEGNENGRVPVRLVTGMGPEAMFCVGDGLKNIQDKEVLIKASFGVTQTLAHIPWNGLPI